MATIANETMIRFWDFNDTYHFVKGPGDLGACHPSDTFAAVLALGERQRSSGKQVIEAAVAGYEIMGRMIDSFKTGLEPKGFHHGSVMPFAGAAIAGKLLGLTSDQIMHAMGIGAVAAVGLGILDAEGEEYNNSKNIADGLMVERGMLGAFLAGKGFTGPERIIEGNKGFAYCLLQGPENYISKMPNDRFYLLESRMKYYPVESTNQGHLAATCDLVREYSLKPEDIEEITLRISKRTLLHNGDPAKKYPHNKETADHSVYFMTALAVVANGPVVPSHFTKETYDNPVIHKLSERVKLEHGPEFDATTPAAKTTIRTKDGRTLIKQMDFPRGTPKNRMSDEEIRNKFVECTRTLMTIEQVDRIADACLHLEQVENIGELMPLLVVS
jgi:2-methylcitrate dehydratase